MDFLSCGEKDPAKYSTYPGWHSSHIYQHKPSTVTCLQHLSDYNGSTGEPKTWVAQGTRTTRDIYDFNKQTEIPSIANFPSHTKLSQRELTDYIGEVRNLVPMEKQRSDKGRYAERDSYAQHKGWENTWPINYRGIRENSHDEMRAYADCYHHSLSRKPPRFEVDEWRSSRCASDMGCGQWPVSADTTQQFQPMSQKKDQTELIGEHRWKWSPWNSRNTESVFPVGSFRQPPSYTAPPAYSSPKNGEKRAGIPKAAAKAFQQQTFDSRKVQFTDLTETHCNPISNNGHYLQKNSQTQNTESYRSDITGGQHCLEALNTSTVLQYTTINTKPQLQYRESPQITHPDITQTKQTKSTRRKGGETVFCLVSRMGEVSGLSSSPEEPLKSHVLPLLTDNKTITTEQTNSPQHSDDSRQNQDVCLKKDEALEPLDGSLMFGEYEHAPVDQRSSSIQDLGNAIKPEENKEELQCYGQGNDSESNRLAQKSPMQTDRDEKSCREITEKFPLWKEPKYQHHLTDMTEQSQRINDELEVSNNSTNDQQQSLVVIDATCVVVKVELVLLPEKEHVQYVCLTEESPSSTEVQKQHSSAVSSQETPENNTSDERTEGILGIAHEHPKTSVETRESVSEEHDSSCESLIVDPVKEFEESPSAASTVDDWQAQENKLMVGHSWSGTTLENNEGVEETLNIMKVEEQTTAQEPEAVLEDFVAFTNAKSTSEVSGVQPENNNIHMNQSTEQGPALDDSVVEHSTQKDNENHQTDPSKDLNEDSSTEDNLSDDKRVLDSDCSTPVLRKSVENCIKVVLPSPVGSRTLRRSSSSPHLSFTSASNALDVSSVSSTPVVSHTENEPLLLLSFTKTETTQCSGSPSVQSSCTSSLPSPSSTPLPEAFEDSSLPQTRNVPSDVLVCNSSPCEQTQKIQQAESLWDAVSRIRKHTAPDSETEDEEMLEFREQTESADTDLLYQRLNTEEEG